MLFALAQVHHFLVTICLLSSLHSPTIPLLSGRSEAEFLFLACGTAYCHTLRVLPVQIRGDQSFPAAIQFFCTENCSRDDCKNDIFILRQSLARYPLDKLGSWSFVLASSDEWEPLMTRLRLPPRSPVFSMLGRNTTIFSRILFSASADRRAELLKTYGVPISQLLDLAISHELGHAFCHELDEAQATSNAEQLRAGHFPRCKLHEARRSLRVDDDNSSFTTPPTAALFIVPAQTPPAIASSDPPLNSAPSTH